MEGFFSHPVMNHHGFYDIHPTRFSALINLDMYNQLREVI